jgi:hypothetical protein
VGQKPRHLSLMYAIGMVCQYSRAAQVSSEKHETAADAGADGEGSPIRRHDGHRSDGSLPFSARSTAAMSRVAKATKALRFMTPARLYVYDTLLERVPQDLEDMAAALGPCIQAAHALVRSRHLAAANQAPQARSSEAGRPGNLQPLFCGASQSIAMITGDGDHTESVMGWFH